MACVWDRPLVYPAFPPERQPPDPGAGAPAPVGRCPVPDSPPLLCELVGDEEIILPLRGPQGPPAGVPEAPAGGGAGVGAAAPWLSVVIPVYNEERTVDALLRRVF